VTDPTSDVELEQPGGPFSRSPLRTTVDMSLPNVDLYVNDKHASVYDACVIHVVRALARIIACCSHAFTCVYMHVSHQPNRNGSQS
jgi:hypothetical protein